MLIFRPERLAMLRRAVAVLKERGWPPIWRKPLSEIAVEGLNVDAKDMNMFISTLNPDEWDSLDLPSPAKYERPPSARRQPTRQPVDRSSKDAERGKTQAERKEARVVARKKAWMPALIAEAERLHLAGERVTFQRITMGTFKKFHMTLKPVYEFVRTHYTETNDLIALKILNPDGTPIVHVRPSRKAKIPRWRLRLENKVEEKGLSDKDKSLLARIDEQYEAALSDLPPESRTRDSLAQHLGKQPFVIDAYLYQHPDFAFRLLDGKKVIDTAFLTKPS